MLWAEALVISVAPAGFVMLAYVALALFGLAGPAAFAAALLIALLALGFGLVRLRVPTAQNIDRRIEAASGLRHRPLAAADDTPAGDDPLAAALWAAHQRRVAAALRGARVGGPAFGTADRDPYALRGLLLLVLLTGLVCAGPAALPRLAAAFVLPAWPFTGPSVDAWITPPAYDSAPPLLLTPGRPATALAGSRLTVIVNGPTGAPLIRFGAAPVDAQSLDARSHRADTVLTRSGRLVVGPWWHRLGTWTIDVVTPAAPTLRLTEFTLIDPQHLRIGWQAADPYGLTGIRAVFQPAGHPGALREAFALSPDAHSARLDIAPSPYAGLAVNVTLSASNLAGRNASTALRQPFLLPPATLRDKTAIALAAVRQNLALNPGTIGAAGAAVQKIAALPPSLISFSADLRLAALGTGMALHATGAAAAADRLGALIAEIEAGPDYAPRRALAQADQALLHALERGLNGQRSSAGEVRNLLQAMRDALARHLAAIAPQTASPPQGGQRIDMSALDQLAQKIAADEAAGRTAQAAQELKQLEAALNALQSATPMSAAQAAQAQAQAQAAQALSQLTNGEAALLDETHRGTATSGEQGALSSALGALEQQLKQAGMALPGLPDAGRAMQSAQGALNQQDSGQAEAAEAQAIQNLQKAASALAAETPKTFSVGQTGQGLGAMPGSEGVNGAPDESSDPGLGNPTANPADAIQQQIIKQDANPALPPATHQYLGRLLQPDP